MRESRSACDHREVAKPTASHMVAAACRPIGWGRSDSFLTSVVSPQWFAARTSSEQESAEDAETENEKHSDKPGRESIRSLFSLRAPVQDPHIAAERSAAAFCVFPDPAKSDRD